MLLGPRALLNCKALIRCCRSPINSIHCPAHILLSRVSQSGDTRCSSSTTDTAASNGHNTSTTQQQHHSHSLVRPAASQQIQYQQQLHHQPHHRQLHPKPASQVAPMQQFEIVSETAVHSRYLSVYDRQVKFCATENPSACRVLDFDVVGHPRANFCFAVTFPFHPYSDGRKGGEVTLIREYAQGPNALMYCLPTGGLDPKKHTDIAACAAQELSEEAWLAGGQWHRLIPDDHPGLPEVKWCMNRFVPFLVIDPHQDDNPGSRDAEEASMEVLRVPLDQFRKVMVSGDLMLPSITTAYMALDRLKEQGYL